MKPSTIRKGLLLLAASSTFALGCELIVDFDRTRIPVEGAEASSPVDATTDVGETEDASGDAADDAAGDATSDADAGDDAADAADDG